ncbi:uncharacterized protein KY384_007948 [Bacidia gigantensis]|uniref:uncharacterized protein n=1 Tax=Bacidia gigantensis TaxID=2732470 RepID=UPI001D057FD3|nr:uncharacterized protein KY384_007948 [Bacidia gigantensis]KAG8527794.1 hypothetical protein KY384_007948 [Bacidia gigantensis]
MKTILDAPPEIIDLISIQTGVHVDCLETFPDDLATNLPVCLKSLPNLQTLSISDLVFSHPQSSARSAKIEQYLMTAIQAILHHARLDNLEDLRLRLPLTYDFATLAKAPLPDEQSKPGNDLPTVMRRLRHLKVGISDTSGPGGHMIYFDPPTMSQAQWPNVRYAREFFGFLEMAPNIHSLEVSCTHKLDMDKLNVVKFQNLRKLCLNRLTVSPEHLQTLLSQNQTAIRALRLNAIGLKDGTWEEIFISLCSFPRLTQFWVEYCGYDPRGASSGFIDPSITPYDIAKDLVSVHRGDFDALGDLQRHVMRLRDAARLTQISREVYQWGFMPSLDSATSHE